MNAATVAKQNHRRDFRPGRRQGQLGARDERKRQRGAGLPNDAALSADAETLGKNIGDDLAEGKPTLPLILSRKYLEDEQQAVIDETIRQGGIERIDEIVELITASGALKESMDVAKQRSKEAMQALSDLPDSVWKDAMTALASYSVSRNY